MKNHKQISIREDIHLKLKRYCCDHSLTIVEATTEVISDFLHQKKYLHGNFAVKEIIQQGAFHE